MRSSCMCREALSKEPLKSSIKRENTKYFDKDSPPPLCPAWLIIKIHIWQFSQQCILPHTQEYCQSLAMFQIGHFLSHKYKPILLQQAVSVYLR